MGGVAGAGCGEAAHAAGLADPLLEDLAVGRLAVADHHPRVDRLVALALGRVDAELVIEGIHAEGAALVGDDRDYPWSELGVAQESL